MHQVWQSVSRIGSATHSLLLGMGCRDKICSRLWEGEGDGIRSSVQDVQSTGVLDISGVS
mgnify:CR=1 FL=1